MADGVPSDFLARVQHEYLQARQRFQSQSNAQAAWQLGRACFDLADASADKTRKAQVAEEGVAACRQALALDPASAPAHYYLGMNLGELADTRRNLGALRLVKDMEREFSAARAEDERFDFAGPDRNLGLLYLQAPRFISIGNRDKARDFLSRAVALAPDYPENRLELIEAWLKWEDLDHARRDLDALEKIWPAARRKFTGPAWAESWLDWEKRLKAAQSRVRRESKPLESPHAER